MADDPPKELTDAIAEGRALLICGAGVSQAATNGAAPGWATLIKEALAEAGAQTGGMDQKWVRGCQEFLESETVEDWLNAAETIQK